MKYKAIYDAESDVPAEVKAFYKLKDGKWVFDGADFDGLAGLLNPGLEANRSDIHDQLTAQKTKVTTLTTQLSDAQKKVKDLEKHGTVAITEAEKADFDKYKSFGAVKDIEEKLQSGNEAIEKVSKFETEKEIRELAKVTAVNADALVDFKLYNERGRDIELSKEKKKVKKGNKEEERWVLVVVKTDKVNGEDKKTNTSFSEFVTEKSFPDYLVKGILQEEVKSDKTDRDKRTSFRLPDSIREKTEDDNTKVVKKVNNKVRDTRQLPWMKKSE
ncbi:MAG: hypothetical protein WBP82_09185 [Leuconostoc mesenteroides]